MKNFPGTVLAVTHDRHFLDSVTSQIMEIDRGQIYTYQGNYSQYLLNKQKRILQEHNEDSIQAKFLSKELQYLKQQKKGNKPKKTVITRSTPKSSIN